MQKIRRKLKAFTVIELVVVLIISGILTAMLFYIFHFITKQYRAFEFSNKEAENTYQLDQQLRTEFDKAVWISEYSRGILFQLPQHQVYYEFTNEYIIRTQATRTDTFHYAVDGYKAYFITTESKRELVNSLRFTILNNNQQKELHYLKEYDAQTLINLKEEDLF